tara:strand:+ start:3655 stop:4821 length:1167 start_codon:yes stop_codon:yes gene_type:complete
MSNEITPMPMAEMQSLAQDAAKSGMFGLQNPSQAICLMALCQAEGINPVLALRRYHIIEGKPSMRADAMLAEFAARGGGVIWHVRNDEIVVATFFIDSKKMDEKAIERARTRAAAMLENDHATVMESSFPGEETIIRSMADADAKKTSMSWDKDTRQFKKKHVWQANPRQMLTARVITEGVRLIAPGVVAGIYAPEEIEDSRESFLQDAGASPSHDVESMRSILAQHEQNAMDATTEPERKKFQGLAADMRLKIQEVWDKEKPTKEEVQTVKVLADHSAKEIAKKMTTDMTRGATDDIPGLENCKLVKGSEIPQPAPKPAAELPWPEHLIACIKSPAYRGKRLDSFSREEIETLHNSYQKKDLKAASPDLQHEAAQIAKAHEHWSKNK